jgi:hypothetical protein
MGLVVGGVGAGEADQQGGLGHVGGRQGEVDVLALGAFDDDRGAQQGAGFAEDEADVGAVDGGFLVDVDGQVLALQLRAVALEVSADVLLDEVDERLGGGGRVDDLGGDYAGAVGHFEQEGLDGFGFSFGHGIAGWD